MMNAWNMHMEQKASDVNNDRYMNCVQAEMVTSLRAKKKK